MDQVAPGVTKNRPQCCSLPLYEDELEDDGHTKYMANTWYEHLEYHGNTSINPFFYGTYLGKTKPGEPVTRTKKQAFQADAVGVAHQLTPAHFKKAHTFRVEWQPGPGGRIDWYTKDHKINTTFSMEGDGLGKDWVHIFGIKDESLSELTGSQIPIEPSYLIFNTAVSSTWGFPSEVPDSCTTKCYDCDNPKCACNFAPGFCKMLRETDVAMYIDSVRLYQSRDPVIGKNHSIGCDPIEYPTKEWIKGHSYQYMRNAPFSNDDKGHPLKKVQTGGGLCSINDDCGASASNSNLTEIYELGDSSRRHVEQSDSDVEKGRGKCVPLSEFRSPFFAATSGAKKVCKCNPGFTGPHCLAEEHTDYNPSAYEEKMKKSIFNSVPKLYVSPFLLSALVGLLATGVIFACMVAGTKRRAKQDSDY